MADRVPLSPVPAAAQECARDVRERSRFALATLGESGLCLDLRSGNFFGLNGTALRICKALVRGDSVGTIERELTTRFSLSRIEAKTAVAGIVRQLAAEYETGRRSRLTFDARPGNYVMRWDGAALLSVDASMSSLAWRGALEASRAELTGWLRVAVPHLLMAVRQPVLHASAVCIGGRVIAFSGASGAGKTTCASMLSQAGAALVSEDLLVLDTSQGAPSVLLEGEGILRKWAEEVAAQMNGSRSAPTRLPELVARLRGESAPLRTLLFLDESRRGGDSVSVESLPATRAAAGLLENGFGELGHAQIWIDLLNLSRVITERVQVQLATVPHRIDALREALVRYSTNSTS